MAADIEAFNTWLETAIADPKFLYLALAMLVWKLVWYGLAIYKTIGKQQKKWFVVLFVCAFILNDLGILPIIYLLIYRNRGKKKK